MHIAEGILAPEVLAAGAVLGGVGTAYGLYRLDVEDVPRAAVLSAGFFVASLIHVPLGPASVHLVLNGLLGVVLGWAAFPAVLVALVLQALFFGYGGFTALGVNTLVMAGPAVLVHYLFRSALQPGGNMRFAAGFGAGAIAIALGAVLASAAVAASGKAFSAAATALLTGHVPIMLIEGFITGSMVVFLARVRPKVLGGAHALEEGSYG
ncbi:MAG: cobalt transporter CbiM [Candidatus Hydrogenedentota bacterium]